MPRGTLLSDQKYKKKIKIKINFFHNQECFNREIGGKIKDSESVARYFFKKGQNYGDWKPIKGNTKLKNVIKQEATRYKLNSTQIKNKSNLPKTFKSFAHNL